MDKTVAGVMALASVYGSVGKRRKGYAVQYEKLQVKGMSAKDMGTTGKRRRKHGRERKRIV